MDGRVQKRNNQAAPPNVKKIDDAGGIMPPSALLAKLGSPPPILPVDLEVRDALRGGKWW